MIFSLCNIGFPKYWRKRYMSKSFIASRGRYPDQITSSMFNFPGWSQPAAEDAFTRVCAPWQFRCSTKFTKRLESWDATSYSFAGMYDSSNGCYRLFNESGCSFDLGSTRKRKQRGKSAKIVVFAVINWKDDHIFLLTTTISRNVGNARTRHVSLPEW